MIFANSIFSFSYVRRKTIEVKVGDILIGGENPIVIQSMGTVDTNNVEDCVAQVERIVEAGAEIVRFTTQGEREVKALSVIHQTLRHKGSDVPIVADVHFNSRVAFSAAKAVEKVRINPGNFIDKRAKFEHIDYTEEEYKEEIKGIYKTLKELIDICKENKTALRIGVNHGSLSDRIMSRYGNTTEGMVESALEFLRICKQESFDNIVVSMKSSNTSVMVKAYRDLVDAMNKEEMCYPLHLGVTEAGEGSEGRIRSAVGVGALLVDGIGDTIRVSLTEEPENEAPVARYIIDYCNFQGTIETENLEEIERVEEIEGVEKIEEVEEIERIDNLESLLIGDITKIPFMVVDDALVSQIDSSLGDFEQESSIVFLELNNIDKIDDNDLVGKILVLKSKTVQHHRLLYAKVKQRGLNNKTVMLKEYNEDDIELLELKASVDFGVLLLDGLGDGYWLRNSGNAQIDGVLLKIMQASGRRISQAEYISCPGCGRTLYNIQEAVKKVKEQTRGLKNLKIAVMGCIVNGPGEMADANYGYVGSGRGVITLYKDGHIVEKNIPEEKAIDRLISLIKENGDWRV